MGDRTGAAASGAVDPPLGADAPTLGRDTRRLLASTGLCNAGLAVSGVFVGLFFYVTSGDVTSLVCWAAGRYLGLIVTTVAALALAPTVSPRRLFRAGLAGYALFYLLLIGLGTRAAPFALPLGLANGVAAGVYWFGANTLVYDVVQPAERHRYYGANFALQNMLSVVMPLAAGFLIARIGGQAGYAAAFALALAAFAAALQTTRRLRDAANVGGPVLSEVMLLPVRRARWRRAWVAVALRGYKQAAGSVVMVALVYLATRSASAQGEYQAVAGLAAALTSMVAGRLPRRLRGAAVWAGAGGFLLATILLIGRPDLSLLLVYGLVTGLLYPGLMVPVSAVVLDTIDADPQASRHRGGYIVSRELAANLGRLAALGTLGVLLSLVPLHEALVALLGATGVLQLVVARLAGDVSAGSPPRPRGHRTSVGPALPSPGPDDRPHGVTPR